MTRPGHRRRRLPRLAPVRARCSPAAARGLPRRLSRPGSRANVAHLLREPALLGAGARRHRVPADDRCRAAWLRPTHLQPRLAAEPPQYQRDPVHHARPTCSAPASARARGRDRARCPPGLDAARSTATPRSTRSPRATAATSTRSARAPATTRASAAPSRLVFDYHRARGVDVTRRPHLQHLRPADGARRRPRGLQLHRPGAARGAAHGLRRRPPDPELLLRRRPGRRRCSPDGQPDESPARSTSATPSEFTVLELAERVLRADRLPLARLDFLPLPADDPRRRRPASSAPARCSAGGRGSGSTRACADHRGLPPPP